jgi:hypothetical protein
MANGANKYNVVQLLMNAVDSSTGGIRFSEGTTVPTDATAGYAKSAIFIHTDASGIADSLYVNVGTVSSCNFDPFPTTLTSDELAAIQGAATPTAANVFATMADVVAASVPADTIVNAQVNSAAAIDYSKMAALATGQLVVGNAGVPTATTVTGDVTIGATGVTAIGAGKVTSAMLAGSIDPSKVTLTDAHVVIGNGSNVGADVAITGDIGVTNGGVVSISSGVIVDADINASAAIALSKLATTGDYTGTGDITSGLFTSADATTPGFVTATGKTNTGYVQVNGKTSGAFKITTADATAQTVTLTCAAQTSGAGALGLPDMAGVAQDLVLSAATQTLTNKTIDGDSNTIQDLPYTCPKVLAAVDDAEAGIPFTVVLTTDSADLTDSYTVPAGKKLRVLDAYAIKIGANGGASDTVQVFNGANPITDAMSLNINDQYIVRAGTINDAYWEVAAGAALTATAVEATTDADAKVVITCVWVTA